MELEVDMLTVPQAVELTDTEGDTEMEGLMEPVTVLLPELSPLQEAEPVLLRDWDTVALPELTTLKEVVTEMVGETESEAVGDLLPEGDADWEVLPEGERLWEEEAELQREAEPDTVLVEDTVLVQLRVAEMEAEADTVGDTVRTTEALLLPLLLLQAEAQVVTVWDREPEMLAVKVELLEEVELPEAAALQLAHTVLLTLWVADTEAEGLTEPQAEGEREALGDQLAL
jgi:hypothetical protein